MTSQSRFSPSGRQVARAVGWLGPWLSLGALGLWASIPDVWFLLLAAAGVVVGALGPRLGRSAALGSVLLLTGILAGFSAQRQVARLDSDWDGYWSERVTWVGDRLNTALDRRMRAGEDAVEALARLDSANAAPLVDRTPLAVLRREAGLSALALYDGEGALVVWDGDHRGKVPEEVQRGLRRYTYAASPLFGYLYVTAPTPRAGVAVAAFLLTADLPAGLGAEAGDFASSFRDAVGEEIVILPHAPAANRGVWDLELPDRTLLSVVLREPDPTDRRAEILDWWRILVTAMAALAWGFLAVGSPKRIAGGAAAAAGLLVLAATAPMQLIGGLEPLFRDATIPVWPGGGASVGRLALVVMALVTAVAVLPRPRFRIPYWVAGAVAGILYPLILAWIGSGIEPSLWADGRLSWVVYEGTAATMLTVLTGSLLVFTSARPSSPWPVFVAASVATGVAAGGAWLVWVTPDGIPGWWPALMAVPVALAARSLGMWTGWQRPVVRWVMSAMIAGAATIPVAWGNEVAAHMALGEAGLDRMAAPRDPDLEVTLIGVARVVARADSAGRTDVGLLYDAWNAGGLAELGWPAWFTLWSEAGVPQEELGIGLGSRPVVAAGGAIGEVDRDREVRLERYDRDDARYVLRVPLTRGRTLTVVTSPFGDPALSPRLGPFEAGEVAALEEPLTLIPLAGSDEREGAPLRWIRTGSGWQAERVLRFSGALYDAHYAVRLPSGLLALARGTLLSLANLVVFLLFWVVGRALLREVLPAEARWTDVAVSFRARVTLALFAFFLLAIAVFGALASRTLEGASRRAGQVLARRVVEDAASLYFEVSGSMDLLAGRVGTELLEYRNGELRDGSVEELVALGLYEGWTPFDIHQRLDGREGVREFTQSRLGEWEYITAYRRLPDGDILAAQVPLQAGATAIRTGDLVELLGFAAVVGGLLSLALAFLVGRALTRPIRALSEASEQVGAGDLDPRLPEERSDEFGAVFRAFNRMVRRIRRARRNQERTSRRTQAIMAEAAVGMVALSPDGRVTLVNPRAEEVLETPVQVGEPLPDGGLLGPALSEWLLPYLAGEEDESGVELHAGERRIRVRVRRLEQRPARGGAVLALEDVTDELRTERVLAWGEMARQVAHEVKNPLTPIKLSVQHVRRAWEDGRADFDTILRRNADVILGEIDRLAGIAQSFSRFGAPSGAEAGPLAAVVLQDIVGDVMALYGASEAPVVFTASVAPDIPAVTARPKEVKEVLVNLLENARAGVGDSGHVRIEADRAPDGSIELRVVDDGVGIPQELLPRVLDPHFSTRSAGTGLGLAIVRRLVESWGGTVSLTNDPAGGTRVVLALSPWQGGPGGGTGGPNVDRTS